MFHQSHRITKIQKSTHIVTTPPSYFAVRKCKYMFKPHYKASRPAKTTNEQHPLGAFLRTSRARADGEQTGTRLPHAIHASLYRFSQKMDVSQIGSNGIYKFPDAASEGHVARFPIAKAKPMRGHQKPSQVLRNPTSWHSSQGLCIRSKPVQLSPAHSPAYLHNRQVRKQVSEFPFWNFLASSAIFSVHLSNI